MNKSQHHCSVQLWILPLLSFSCVVCVANAVPSPQASSSPLVSTPKAVPNVISLTVDPNSSQVHFTVDSTLHTVHGSFKLSKGSLQLDSGTGKASGEIVVLATSGETGNDGRDKKMHKDVLESSRFPDIVFHPDRVDGKVAPMGDSSVQLHGVFIIHGAEHEMTVPVQANLAADHWTATSKFSVPYIQWGLKNPSTFILRVDKEVELELDLHGQLQSTPH
jgi:polyisoprenoid-binding protein YceI